MSNEAKITKAYKVSPELKEKLERLSAESGLDTQEAFIEHLAALYDMQQLKEGNGSGYRKQIDELEYHLRRPLELFIGMIDTEAAERLQIVQQHDETMTNRASVIQSLEQKIMELRKEMKAHVDEMARMTKENADQAKLISQLEVTANDKGMLVEEYRKRIDTLSGLINEYKVAAEENRNLQTKISELTTLMDKQVLRVESLEGDVATLSELKDDQLRQQEERHRDAQERILERMGVEKERELLAIRTEYQAKLEKANEDATTKIRELYEQIEYQRVAHEQQLREIQQAKDDEKTPPKK